MQATGRLHENEIPPNSQQVQTELTYFLARQFIDGLAMLEELTKKDDIGSDGEKNFYLFSIIELIGEAVSIKENEVIYPSKARNQKLYLKNQAGKKLGYLFFLDDRLNYIVILLFEPKRVQVKLQVAHIEAEKRRKGTVRY